MISKENVYSKKCLQLQKCAKALQNLILFNNNKSIFTVRYVKHLTSADRHRLTMQVSIIQLNCTHSYIVILDLFILLICC